MRCLYFWALVCLMVTACTTAGAAGQEPDLWVQDQWVRTQWPDSQWGYEHWVHGEIVEVFPGQNKLRVLADGEMIVLELTCNAEIYRKGRLVSLNSARPVTESRFQEGLFFFNSHGEVILMVVDYSIAEVQTEAGNIVVYYDIFGRVKDMEQFPPFERDPVICSE